MQYCGKSAGTVELYHCPLSLPSCFNLFSRCLLSGVESWFVVLLHACRCLSMLLGDVYVVLVCGLTRCS
jgi:hypothetical protein